MKTLSIRQPWAWLIANGHKPVENRDWRTHMRGPVLIHASKTMTYEDEDACRLFVASFSDIAIPPRDCLLFGGIIAVATLADCVTEMDSPWFCGRYGFVFQHATRIGYLPCRGHQGFWDEPEPEVLVAFRKMAEQARVGG